MGKKLIIKGADFSENAVGEVKVINITNLISFADNTNGVTLESNKSNRAGIKPRFDLTSYISDGYTKIKVVTKRDYIVVFQTNVTGDATNATRSYVVGDQGVYGDAGTYEKAIDTTNVYLGANIDKDNAGSYSVLSAYMDVFLLKE